MCAPTYESKAQNLPQELLAEIFVRCLPKNVFDHLQPNSSLPPLVLCHVCRSWRKAALGASHLWNELSMELAPVSSRSLGSSGFLYSRIKALEIWGSHRRALLPSLHFRRVRFQRSISDKDLCKLVPFRTFFRSPAILNAQLLTLDGFSNVDTLKLSISLADISFDNLEYLAITQPPNSGYSTLLRPFHTCPTLRRLQIDFHTLVISPRSLIVTGFSWVTLTHLNANLKIGRQDWAAILAQCTNMTSCSIALVLLANFPETNDRPPTLHHNLRTLNVQGTTETHSNIFNGFVFPSLVALRLSWTNSGATLRNVHQMITATPALKEFHLQFHHSSDLVNFLLELQESHLAGPLSKFVPGLLILVLDRITPSHSSDILPLLHSSWLNDDWVTLSRTQMTVEFIFDKGGPSHAEDFNGEIGRCGSLPFHASARYVPGGLWNWKQLTARELRDCWDDSLAFRHN